MTTIQFNDPIIAQVIRQEGLENITNDILGYIKNKFSKKSETPLSAYLDQQIRDAKPTNIIKADKLQKTMEGLNALLDPTKKNLTLGEAKEQYFNYKAN